MRIISKQAKLNRSAVVVSLKDNLPAILTHRQILLSKLSGRPQSIHVIGRLQKMINLSSYADMLASLRQIRDIVRLASDVIDTMEGVKVDKYQMNKTEIVAYIKDITATVLNQELSTAEQDLVASLISSFEASPSTWILQAGTQANEESSFIQQASALYTSILSGTDDTSLPIYATHSDQIVALSELGQYKKGEVKDRLTKDAVFTRLAATRVVDHVINLLMDNDAWYQFVVPRQKADLASNLQRSEGLKLFSLHCQALLTYPYFFNLECFLGGYDLIQDWITHLPALDSTTASRLEDIIRPHDLLNAREDVRNLLNSMNADKGTSSPAANEVVFPAELLHNYGAAKAIAASTEKAKEYIFADTLDSLSSLDSSRYLALLSGIPMGDFNVTYDVTAAVVIGQAVSGVIEGALAGLVPAITRGSSSTTVARYHALNVHCGIPFVLPRALSYNVTGTTLQGLIHGNLHLDSGATIQSLAYGKYLRTEMRFKMASDQKIANSYPYFAPPFVYDYDKAKDLREIFGLEWGTLVPSFMKPGDRSFSVQYSAATDVFRRELLESISGMNYEIAVREMEIPHIMMIWATYISSFGLLYYGESALMDGARITPTSIDASTAGAYQLVQGHGKPYGGTYGALENLQGPLAEGEHLIPLFGGLAIRFLKRIPLPTYSLEEDPRFYAEQPVSYFASNSASIEVKEWVLGEGLLNFCCLPIPSLHGVPAIRYTNNKMYLNSSLYLNADLTYNPAQQGEGRETFPIPVHEKEWKYDKHRFFLKYITFDPYLKPASVVITDDTEEMVKKTVELMEKDIKDAVAEGNNSINAAGKTHADLPGHVASEVASLAGDPKPVDRDADIVKHKDVI